MAHRKTDDDLEAALQASQEDLQYDHAFAASRRDRELEEALRVSKGDEAVHRAMAESARLAAQEEEYLLQLAIAKSASEASAGGSRTALTVHLNYNTNQPQRPQVPRPDIRRNNSDPLPPVTGNRAFGRPPQGGTPPPNRTQHNRNSSNNRNSNNNGSRHTDNQSNNNRNNHTRNNSSNNSNNNNNNNNNNNRNHRNRGRGGSYRGHYHRDAPFADDFGADADFEQALAMSLQFAAPNAVSRSNNVDVDRMSYEELLALEEKVGKVSKGLSVEQISILPAHRWGAQEGQHSCPICLETFGPGDLVTTLPCVHPFHSECITKHLQSERFCPTCRADVNAELGTDPLPIADPAPARGPAPDRPRAPSRSASGPVDPIDVSWVDHEPPTDLIAEFANDPVDYRDFDFDDDQDALS